MTRVGFIGLGIMGAPMAANVLRAGFPLTVFNRTPAKAAPLVAAGAQLAGSAAEAARGTELLVLCLPTDAELREVLSAARPAEGSVVVDTSTVSAVAARELAAGLSREGVGFLDAPVSGGRQGAIEGTLVTMVGGPEDIFERCLPVLQSWSKSVVRVGDTGAGQLAKACNQIAVAAGMVAVSEIVALCRNSAVDPMVVREILLDGTARSTVVEVHMKRLVEGNDTPGFRAALMHKDLAIARATLLAAGVPAPATEVSERLLHALVEEGGGERDWTAVGTLLQRRS